MKKEKGEKEKKPIFVYKVHKGHNQPDKFSGCPSVLPHCPAFCNCMNARSKIAERHKTTDTTN